MSPVNLIENATIVTMNEKREVLLDSSLAYEGDSILAVGPAAELVQRFPGAARIDGRGKVVLPGLINCHTHIPMSLQKGLTLAVPEGLYKVMWPLEKNLTAQDVRLAALAGGAEALKGGSTTVVDHYFFAEQTAEAIIELGLRGVIGHTIMSRLGPITGEKELEEGIDFVKRWKGRNPLVIPWLAPHASDTVSKEWLLRLRQVASDEQVGLHMHLAQSPREEAYIREQYGMGCVEYLERIGYLGPDVIAAHCIFISDGELDILARSGAYPIYCPMVHSLGGRPMRAWELLKKGAGVVIGTDCVCANNVMDLVGELRIAGVGQKQMNANSQVMPAIKILEMVTVDAAEAIGMKGKLGALVPGALADLLVLDFDGMPTAPVFSLLDNIVYCLTGRDVDTVIVNGKVVVQAKKLVNVDERELVKTVSERSYALVSRALQLQQDPNWKPGQPISDWRF